MNHRIRMSLMLMLMTLVALASITSPHIHAQDFAPPLTVEQLESNEFKELVHVEAERLENLEPIDEQSTDSALRKLLIRRHNLALEHLRLMRQVFYEVVDVQDRVIDSQIQFFQSAQALATTNAQRVEWRRREWLAAAEIEGVNNQRRAAGTVRFHEMVSAVDYRLAAELRLWDAMQIAGEKERDETAEEPSEVSEFIEQIEAWSKVEPKAERPDWPPLPGEPSESSSPFSRDEVLKKRYTALVEFGIRLSSIRESGSRDNSEPTDEIGRAGLACFTEPSDRIDLLKVALARTLYDQTFIEGRFNAGVISKTDLLSIQISVIDVQLMLLNELMLQASSPGLPIGVIPNESPPTQMETDTETDRLQHAYQAIAEQSVVLPLELKVAAEAGVRGELLQQRYQVVVKSSGSLSDLIAQGVSGHEGMLNLIPIICSIANDPMIDPEQRETLLQVQLSIVQSILQVQEARASLGTIGTDDLAKAQADLAEAELAFLPAPAKQLPVIEPNEPDQPPTSDQVSQVHQGMSWVQQSSGCTQTSNQRRGPRGNFSLRRLGGSLRPQRLGINPQEL